MSVFYEYSCAEGHRWEHHRPVSKRNDPTFCPVDGAEGRKVFSVPVIHWPQALWTQWGDVHEKSAREMAHDPSVERYDPTGPVQPVKVDVRAGLGSALKEAHERS